jgi:hypothetical protein
VLKKQTHLNANKGQGRSQANANRARNVQKCLLQHSWWTRKLAESKILIDAAADNTQRWTSLKIIHCLGWNRDVLWWSGRAPTGAAAAPMTRSRKKTRIPRNTPRADAAHKFPFEIDFLFRVRVLDVLYVPAANADAENHEASLCLLKLLMQ